MGDLDSKKHGNGGAAARFTPLQRAHAGGGGVEKNKRGEGGASSGLAA
jgi:hypothetical protein